MDNRIKLSTLWIVIMINMIYADIFSIIIELVNGNTFELPGEVTLIMAIAAILTNIPIFMIFLARTLKYSLNRKLNIIAAVFTIIYVVGGGDLSPHYIIIAGIEVTLLVYIISIAYRWKETQKI